ncbi:hypothetical protein KUCAC02_012452 [Chaenocephalus aceratus]|uniref:Uncharacterized protein n=1 Tax=Chaenocephalus aceratus TaxID=36190 RepID=A0ACB9XBZ1_CHAAC|nr:hypothetical protein KUCAC02_012452 [Chaenocephalus aceratus]
MEPIRSIRRPKQLDDFLVESLRMLFRFFAERNSLIAASSRVGGGLLFVCRLLCAQALQVPLCSDTLLHFGNGLL